MSDGTFLWVDKKNRGYSNQVGGLGGVVGGGVQLIVIQVGHIRAEIKFPVFSLCYKFFPCVFFPIKLIDCFE